jgi:hypothetical protein
MEELDAHGKAIRVQFLFEDGAIQTFEGEHAEAYLKAVTNACIISGIHGVPVHTVPHTWSMSQLLDWAKRLERVSTTVGAGEVIAELRAAVLSSLQATIVTGLPPRKKKAEDGGS